MKADDADVSKVDVDVPVDNTNVELKADDAADVSVDNKKVDDAINTNVEANADCAEVKS